MSPEARYNYLKQKKRELEIALSNRDEIQVERHAEDIDRAQAISSRDIAASRLDHDRKVLMQVIRALSKFEDGEYGICEDCEEAIPDARLQVIPWAPYCVSCQGKLDEEIGKRGEPRKLRNYTERGQLALENSQDFFRPGGTKC